MSRQVLQFGFYAGIVNFAIFWLGAVYLGGDALNGKSVDGHYFLANRGHLAEVSLPVFTYSRWHTLSLLITHPFAMFCAWRLNRQANERN